MPVRRWLLALAICCVALRVWAHEGIPAYLEIKELSDARYALTVKRPMQSGRMPPMRLKLPESCRFTDTAETSGAPGSVLEYYNLTCAGGIAGKSIRFEGLEATGLGAIETQTIDVCLTYQSFEDFWQAQTPAYAPTAKTIAAMKASDRVNLMRAVERSLPCGPGGTIEYCARANAIKARVPASKL